MKSPFTSLVASGSLAVLLSLPAGLALAHHPIAAKFDEATEITLTGRVTEIDWSNPHVHIFMNVIDDTGAEINWAIELASTAELDFSGWNPDSTQVVAMLTVVGPVALNGSR